MIASFNGPRRGPQITADRGAVLPDSDPYCNTHGLGSLFFVPDQDAEHGWAQYVLAAGGWMRLDAPATENMTADEIAREIKQMEQALEALNKEFRAARKREKAGKDG